MTRMWSTTPLSTSTLAIQCSTTFLYCSQHCYNTSYHISYSWSTHTEYFEPLGQSPVIVSVQSECIGCVHQWVSPGQLWCSRSLFHHLFHLLIMFLRAEMWNTSTFWLNVIATDYIIVTMPYIVSNDGFEDLCVLALVFRLIICSWDKYTNFPHHFNLSFRLQSELQLVVGSFCFASLCITSFRVLLPSYQLRTML